jgi:hypothetical protein
LRAPDSSYWSEPVSAAKEHAFFAQFASFPTARSPASAAEERAFFAQFASFHTARSPASAAEERAFFARASFPTT